MKFNSSHILIIALFFLSSIFLGTALAGDENFPEVDDDTGDAGDTYDVEKIEKLIKTSIHKRKSPPIISIDNK